MKFNSLNHEQTLNFTPVFIGGAPRSGTSILHATICSSKDTNPYINECTFFTHLVKAFQHGVNNFDLKQKAYFKSDINFIIYSKNLLKQYLIDFWLSCDKPNCTVLKDPYLTEYFFSLSALLPEAKFLVSVRNPLDILASHKSVFLKTYKDQKDFDQTISNKYINEIKDIYGPYIKNQERMKQKFLFIKYEDFIKGKLDNTLNTFLNITIDDQNIWQKSSMDKEIVHKEEVKPWITELTFNPRSSESVSRYINILNQSEISETIKINSELMKNFDYHLDKTESICERTNESKSLIS